MFILFTVANLRRLYDGEGPDRVDEGTLYAIGHGGSRLQPNYERNAEMRLVTAEGQVLAISDAAVAAEQAAQGALVFVNDVLRTAEAAIGEAKDLAKYAKKPVLAVYLAQDFFSPKNDNQPVRAVLWTLAKDTAAQGRELQVVAHGWGGFLAIRELYTRKNVRIQAINPYPNPWHRNQYVIPLRDSLAKIEIIAGNRDFLMLLGGGPGGGGAQIDPAACW
jgi:hypothetical protein